MTFLVEGRRSQATCVADEEVADDEREHGAAIGSDEIEVHAEEPDGEELAIPSYAHRECSGIMARGSRLVFR